MTVLNIKIVSIEGDSVLVKFASQNSAKSIDEYDAIAYQPKLMGYSDLNEFIEAIKPGLLVQVISRDKIESMKDTLDLTSWAGHESSHQMEIRAPMEGEVVL